MPQIQVFILRITEKYYNVMFSKKYPITKVHPEN